MAISELFEREWVKRQSHAAALLLRRGMGSVRIDEALQWARSKAFVQASNKLVTTKAFMLEEEHLSSVIRSLDVSSLPEFVSIPKEGSAGE